MQLQKVFEKAWCISQWAEWPRNGAAEIFHDRIFSPTFLNDFVNELQI